MALIKLLARPTDDQPQADKSTQNENQISEDESSQHLEPPSIRTPPSLSAEENERENIILDKYKEILYQPSRRYQALSETVYFTAEGPSEKPISARISYD